jgi:serine/threonine protein kinase
VSDSSPYIQRIELTNPCVGIIHGDIKPQNVLVFKGDSGGYTAKVTDFGYATLATGDDFIYISRSQPWDAPEYHYRGFKLSDAMKTDIYSFGMLCLWLLFKGEKKYPKQNVIEELKREDELPALANELATTTTSWTDKQKRDLYSFFNSALAKDQNQRSSDIKQLIQLLAENR